MNEISFIYVASHFILLCHRHIHTCMYTHTYVCICMFTHIYVFNFLFASLGGNLLVNVGPTAYGKISPIYEERLRQMGQWLKVNGKAIYGSQPWIYQNDTVNPNVWLVCHVTRSTIYNNNYIVIIVNNNKLI